MIEIERKFLVDVKLWSPSGEGKKIMQGYLSVDHERTVRIRISGKYAWLTIKGKSEGITRQEFEYPIPADEARDLMNLCVFTPIIKTRYFDEYKGKKWEIDVFEKENSGLVLAEVELYSEKENIMLPGWIKKEVSGDERYFNSWLTERPFTSW